MKVNRFYVTALRLALLGARTLKAHREDYIDETLVFQTVEKGAIEPEYWFDYGHRGGGDVYFQRHNLALEYSLTDRLMFDARATADHPENRNANFDSGRFEARYRFGEEGDWPIDVALSGETNMRRLETDHYQYGIEPRLILSNSGKTCPVILKRNARSDCLNAR